MLTSAFVSAPLIRAGAAPFASRPTPRAAIAQRRRCWRGRAHMPQQLSLFGPPGGRR